MKSYFEVQTKRLGLHIHGNLIDCLTGMIEEFKNRVFVNLDTMSTRIVALDRDAPPQILDDVYYTMAPVTLFSLINQQIKLAKDTKEPVIIYATATQVKDVLIAYQAKFRRLFESMFARM